MIKNYFKKIEKILDNHSYIIEDMIIKTNSFADDKGLIEGEVFFIDETALVFLEVVNTNKYEKEKYKYQYMDKYKQLIFRYDNAHHHRDIKSFPHHKHTKTGIEESKEPDFQLIINEIENILINN